MSVKLTYEYAVNVSASRTVASDIDDYVVDATSGNITITLLSAAATGLKGKVFTFRRVDTSTNTVTIAAAGSDTISGVASLLLDTTRVLKIIKFSQTAWIQLMDTKKLLSTATYSALSATLDSSVDVAQLNTAANAVALTLPAANAVPLGTRYIVVTTSASNAGTVVPNGSDTINGAGAAITVNTNAGKTFFTTSTTAWRQF